MILHCSSHNTLKSGSNIQTLDISQTRSNTMLTHTKRQKRQEGKKALACIRMCSNDHTNAKKVTDTKSRNILHKQI